MTLSQINQQVDRLTRIKGGRHPIVSCYLKLEPRDRTRGKYLIKLKNRIRTVQEGLEARGFSRAEQEAINKDLGQVFRDLERPGSLPGTQGIAVFASSGLDLYERVPVPIVHRSRLVVDRTPLIRELLAANDEVGRLLTVVFDRTSARIFEVTAFEAREVLGITSEATRGGKFHSDRHGAPGVGEHTFQNRIRNEKARHLTAVADALFQLDRKQPVHGVVLAGIGTDASAVAPYLHTYLRDRVIATIKLNPKETSVAHVHAATLLARAEFERTAEDALVTEVLNGAGSGWAVDGVRETLKALAAGKLRSLLVDAELSAPGFRFPSGRLAVAARDVRGEGEPVPVEDVVDEAIEDALRQRVEVEVLHSPEAAGRIDGLAGMLRFR